MSGMNRRFFGFVLLSTLLYSLPLFARGQEGEEVPAVVIVAAEAVGDDLAAAIVWNEDWTFRDPALVLRDEEGEILAMENVTPGGPVAVQERLSGALADLWNHDFSLVLEIQDEGVAVGDSFPFFALRECTPEACGWTVLGGLQGDAIVSSAQLDEEIQRLPSCDLGSVLDSIKALQPHLLEEILQLEQQLDNAQVPTGGPNCGYYWHVVVDTPPGDVDGFYQEFAYDGIEVAAEESGFTSGAAYSHMMQARRFTPGVADTPFVSEVATSTVSLDLRCSSGPPSCAQACSGSVHGELDYTTLGTVESNVHASGGSATALVFEEAELLVDSAVVFQKTLYAYTDAGSSNTSQSHSHEEVTAEPVTFSLSSTRQLQVSATYDPRGPLETELGSQGAAHGYAKAENSFHLLLEGTTPLCSTNYPVAVALGWSHFLRGIWIKEGSLRNEKWHLQSK